MTAREDRAIDPAAMADITVRDNAPAVVADARHKVAGRAASVVDVRVGPADAAGLAQEDREAADALAVADRVADREDAPVVLAEVIGLGTTNASGHQSRPSRTSSIKMIQS